MALSYQSMVDDSASAEAFVHSVDRAATTVLTLDDPDRLNPLSPQLTVQLHAKLVAAIANPTTRAIVLTGADPAFSAGGDLRSMVDVVRPMVAEGPEGATSMWRWIRYQFSEIVRLIVRTDKLVVAAVNGPAAGVGLAFALASDLVVASDRARLVIAFARIGLVPEVGTGWLLNRRVGYQKAMELVIAGSPLTADEAHELGLVNEVVAHADLMERACWWAQRATELPPHVLAMTKPLLRQTADLSWDQALTMEEFAEPACFTTADHAAGVDRLLSQEGR